MEKEDFIEPTIPLVEAAHKLGISWNRAWRLLLQGDLKGFKVNGRWVVTRESLQASQQSHGA